ncbi:MAG: fibronectin type III domain-containing protein [Oscillospiraceae bacterium]|jgi:hypothetical protein|nr:fibronectin type III domain-containing protein [Oscillospiraceae bacterium]
MKKKIIALFLALSFMMTVFAVPISSAATKKISSLSISKISDQSYTGKALKPSVTVKDGSKTLKSGTNYTLSYSKNKNIGEAKVKITGKGNYSGSKTVTFKIVPKKVKISSISESKQKITLTWSKVSGSVTGYKVYYSESKNGDYTLLKTVKGTAATSFTTKALNSGTTYYFRVRAYKTVSGADYNGANSAVKSKKTSGKATSAKKGDIIEFGDYYWKVLDVKDGKALIITNKIITYGWYNGTITEVTWENCDLRAYLNGSFYNSFDKSDKARIAKTKVINKNNPWYGTPGGKATDDYIFLLSLEEVVKYFGDSGKLSNRPGDAAWISDQYSGERIAYTPGGSAVGWWLRSPGLYGIAAASVANNGDVLVFGGRVDAEGDYDIFYSGVRPAMWIKL